LANSGEPLILENTATGNGCVIAMGVTCAAEMIPGYSCDEWPEGTEGVVKVMGIDIPNITPAELGQSSLPVKFVSFTASRKKHVTILEWATAIEINNDIFEIERSTDGRRFEKIDQIVGNGTTYNTSIYSYTDNYSINGTNYYMLKQIDFDGKSSYSSIAKTTYNEKSAVRIYPNTTSGLLNIDLGHLSTAYGSVMDINGQKVKAFTINNNYSTLDISNLSNGVYLIQITTNIKSETIKIFKD
ncbi:MAG: T9SS type A sorting domain-containing protein, partial [Saprospiraceae bacterium]